MTGYDMRHNMDVARSAKGNYSVRLFTDIAVQMIQTQESGKPLFLYLPHQAVHAPLEAPQESIDKFSYIADMNRRKLAGTVIYSI